MKHKFRIEFEGSAIIELDDAAIDTVDDEWRSMFYKLHTPIDIAEHIGYNLIINRASLSQLDGWADQPDENAKILWEDEWQVDGYVEN